MRKLLSALLALTLAAGPAAAQTQLSWNEVADRVAKSIVYLEHPRGSCTGFVVHDRAKDKDEDVDYVMTAAHCEGTNLYADQQPTTIIYKDTKKDLMVLKVKNLERPALRLAKDNPKVGHEVASYGYGYGLERPMFRVTHVSDDKIFIPFEGIGGPLVAVDISFVPGQSGGPVVNKSGEVVAIVQLGTQIVGFGIGAETINDRAGRFFIPVAK